jgi:hypothetical protein
MHRSSVTKLKVKRSRVSVLVWVDEITHHLPLGSSINYSPYIHQQVDTNAWAKVDCKAQPGQAVMTTFKDAACTQVMQTIGTVPGDGTCGTLAVRNTICVCVCVCVCHVVERKVCVVSQLVILLSISNRV